MKKFILWIKKVFKIKRKCAVGVLKTHSEFDADLYVFHIDATNTEEARQIMQDQIDEEDHIIYSIYID